MVALEVWYDQEPAHDFGPDDPAILIETLEQLDALIARVSAESADDRIPPMVQANLAGAPGLPVIEAGLGVDRGFIGYLDRAGAWLSAGDAARSGEVTYDYMGNLRPTPASAEIPLADVRQWLADFLANGEPSPTVPLIPVKKA